MAVNLYLRRASGSPVERVAFVNHLRLGSASSFRQAGLAKYLGRLGATSDFLGRQGRQTGRAVRTSEWPCFERISYWNEPLVRRFSENLSLFRTVARDNPILHVNRANPYSATIAALGRGPSNKLVVDMEDWDGFGGYASYTHLYGAKGGTLTLYENVFPRLGDLVLTVSHLLTKVMVHLGVPPEKLLLVPNGYDEELFMPSTSGAGMREKYGLKDSPVVIYMSTFWRFERGLHEIALNAFKDVSAEMPEAKMLLVGGGDLEVSLLVNQLGLQGKAIPTGFVDRSQIPSVIAAADVAMHVISDHPFHAASSPMVMPEYMAMGKPIVAPRIGELAYALDGGAGWLVGSADPNLLAQGVKALLNDEDERREMGQRALKKVKEEYSYARLAAK
ncbi:MAG TPA: glycosyltransferase, partial [Nitrososphaerales archaeon]|nr:glycosyltransferase [Nitrososphaerales archaeon]